MKVLHLLQSSRFSGAENVVCQIIAMAKNDSRFEMVYCSRDGQIRESLAEKGVPFTPLKKISLAEVKRVIREQAPDIIHAHDRSAGILAALAAGKRPVISHMHVNNNKGMKSFLKNLLWTALSGKYRHIFWVSDSAYDQFQFKGILKQKSTVLYNVIDMEALRAKADTDSNTYNYDIVYVGRLTYQKHPERLMKVLHEVIQAKPDAKIAIAGVGEYAQFVSQYIEQHHLGSSIHYLGYTNNPAKLIQSAKVLVMTSRFEGTPIVALEAQCLGVPIVSTPVDGLKTVVENGCNGFLTDDDDTLVRHMVKILTDDDLCAELKANSIKKASEYNDIKKFFSAIASAYAPQQ